MSSEGNYHRSGPYFDGTNFAIWKHKMKMHIFLDITPLFGLLCVLVCKVNSLMGENQTVKLRGRIEDVAVQCSSLQYPLQQTVPRRIQENLPS